MRPGAWAPISCFALGMIFAGLLWWGATGPTAGTISNPVPTQGTVALVDQEGTGANRICSIQATYEVRGKSYGSGQLSYRKDLCRYKLGDSVPVVYNQEAPERSIALKEIKDSPIWPAWIAGGLFLMSLIWTALTLRTNRKPDQQREDEEPEESEARPAPKAARSRTKKPTPSDPAGWYPVEGGRLRWWNGAKWTDNYQ